jgi:hypothetical protein
MTDAEFTALFARLDPSVEPAFVEQLLADIDRVLGSPGAAPEQPDGGGGPTPGPDLTEAERVYLVEHADDRPLAFAPPRVRRRHVVAVLAAAAAVIVVTVAVAVTRPSTHGQPKPPAPAGSRTPITKPRLYWRDATGIRSANLDGTGAVRQLITFNVGADQGPSTTNGGCGVAVDRNYIYWPTGTTVARATRDGTGVDTGFIVTGPGTNCVAVDGGHIYWSAAAGATSGGTIGRANLDGTGVQRALIAEPKAACGLAVDGTYVYWGNSSTGALGRANVDGTGVSQDFLFSGAAPSPAACGVVIDGADIYWGAGAVTPPGSSPESCNDCFSIGDANLGGPAGGTSFATGPGPFLAFNLPCAHDGTHLYWTYSWSGTGAPVSALIGRAKFSPGVGNGFTDVQSDFMDTNALGGVSLVPAISGCAIGP